MYQSQRTKGKRKYPPPPAEVWVVLKAERLSGVVSLCSPPELSKRQLWKLKDKNSWDLELHWLQLQFLGNTKTLVIKQEGLPDNYLISETKARLFVISWSDVNSLSSIKHSFHQFTD